MFLEIEELTLNHWPSLQTVLYDGWILRFAEGYSKRANSVNAIYKSGLSPDTKIEKCEALYSKHKLPAVFKITPVVSPDNLDSLLEQKGYAIVEPSLVKTLDLNHLQKPSVQSVKIESELSGEWLEHHCRMSGKSESVKQTLSKIIANIQAPKVFVTLFDKGQSVSCGFGVIEKDYVGIYNLVTDKNHRNKGHAEQLLLSLLHWAKQHGATRSYLQVVENNLPAIKLYDKLGYKEVYSYWYRVKSPA